MLSCVAAVTANCCAHITFLFWKRDPEVIASLHSVAFYSESSRVRAQSEGENTVESSSLFVVCCLFVSTGREMSKLRSLKVFVNQRLTAAVEEILVHFEKTISEYEEEMNRRHHHLQMLDVVVVKTPEKQPQG